MPLNSLSASPKPPRRKNFPKRENSLPSYEQATEKVLQEAFIEAIATASPADSHPQQQRLNNDRSINNTYSGNRTTTIQLSPRDYGLGRPLPDPSEVPYRNYRVWNTPSTNFTDLRPVEKQINLGFHIVFYLIVIMIILLLIVFITKLMTWVSFY